LVAARTIRAEAGAAVRAPRVGARMPMLRVVIKLMGAMRQPCRAGDAILERRVLFIFKTLPLLFNSDQVAPLPTGHDS